MANKDLKLHDVRSGREATTEAKQLLQALSSMETGADLLAAKLSPFDVPTATLPAKDLSQLREGLKRIAVRVGTTAALAERIGTTPEKERDPPDASGSKPAKDVTPEEKMFPIDGLSDAITGLPARSIAEKALESALESGRPRYAAIIALDRICHMSSRYGVDVGYQAIRHYAQFLHEKLPSDSLLFRWHGPAFLAFFDISGTAADAKLLMEQIAVQRQKFDFMTNHRSAMAILTASFQTISLGEHSGSETVFAQVDQFVDGHSERQPH
jgi:GGDEF domain-containing protein